MNKVDGLSNLKLRENKFGKELNFNIERFHYKFWNKRRKESEGEIR